MVRALMIQGAGSNVGKSVIVAGICRALSNRGHHVVPFKPQNMSNNAAVAGDGMEIGRAQHLQAQACRTLPTVDMNPVLLKPEGESGAQVIVQGKPYGTMRASEYCSHKSRLLHSVLESFSRLSDQAEIVLVEGAGSPAEVNLREGDIANMGFARAADVPVVLIGDIERGGVIAQLVGTREILERSDSALVRGFVVNKFRGDPNLFEGGYRFIENRTGWQGFGLIPWLECARKLPSEDSQDLASRNADKGEFKIACPALSRIANFDDLDPLSMEPDVSLKILQAGTPLPADTDLVLLPGSKSTRDDLEFLRRQGWDIDILAHARRGGRVFGICGGFQMLGRAILDPEGVEGTPGESPGLGLLDVETIMKGNKTVRRVKAVRQPGESAFDAYEIHVGRTTGPDTGRPFAHVVQDSSLRPEGAMSSDGMVAGTYLHGLFADDGTRSAFLDEARAPASGLDYGQLVDDALDSLADHLETHMNLDQLLEVMSAVRGSARTMQA